MRSVEQTQQLAGLVREAGSVVALTGAGISVPSGIPDFRTPGTGMWANVDPMEVAHIDAFRSDPERFWRFYGERFATLEGRRPNGAHLALAQMQGSGALDGVITQNVDMLHRAAGSHDVVEMHGSIATCSCPSCAQEMTLSRARSLAAAARDGVPRCGECAEPVKPDVVLFGEMLPVRALLRARALCERADLAAVHRHIARGAPRRGAAAADARRRRADGDHHAGRDSAGRSRRRQAAAATWWTS